MQIRPFVFFSLFLLFCLLFGLPCSPILQTQLQKKLEKQDGDKLESYIERIQSARRLRDEKRALKLFLEAQQRFSESAQLWFLGGELYVEQNLLRLGLESYREAYELEPQNTRFIYRLAGLQDRLGQYEDALESYRMLEQQGNPIERNEARRKNGWLLYKLHRYKEAEASILSIPTQERSSSVMMTLAIIYSAAYNYEASRRAYEQSLALTYPKNDPDATRSTVNEGGNRERRALIYYNYALLETDFRHFDRAMALTQKSIENFSFPSNELLRGELHLQRRQFAQAEETFLKSQRLEDMSQNPSPLALLDLVQLSIDEGRPQRGMVFFRELEARFREQTGWMTSYGIDPLNFELELMKLRRSLYRGMLQEQKWLLPLNWKENLLRYGRWFRYQWLSSYALIQQGLLSLQVGKEHYREGNLLDASQQLYNASDGDLRRRFFRRLKNEQLSLIPASRGVFLLEEGILQNSVSKIEQSLTLLNEKWDREERERAYIELSKLRRKKWGGRSFEKKTQRYRDLLNAYAINPSALKNNGIALPLQVQLGGSAAYKGQNIRHPLRRYLGRSGAELVRDPKFPALRLQIQWGEREVKAYLLSETGRVLATADATPLERIAQAPKSEQRRLLKQFSRSFMELAFTPTK